MIKVYENTAFTKSIILPFKKFVLILGVKTIKWMIMFFRHRYKIIDYRKDIKSRKLRSKGKYKQAVRKKVRIFCFFITWTIFKEYEKRKVYVYLHKKKYLNLKPSFKEKLKSELKEVFGK